MLSTAHNVFFLSQVPYLFDQRAQIKGSEGRLLRWLHDDGVPTAESRRQLPHQHQQREIPLGTEHRGAWGPDPPRRPVPEAQRRLHGGYLLCMVQTGDVRGNTEVSTDQTCLPAPCFLSYILGHSGRSE